MRRSQRAALAAVAVLLVAAFVAGQRGDVERDPDAQTQLAALRASASLLPCPSTGLGPDLPAQVLPCLAGGPAVPLRGSVDRPTLVNVWGTWCAPCVEEVPDLVAFARKAEGRVAVVGVLTQDTARNGLAFAEQFDMHYPQLVDDDRVVLSRYGAGAPLTLFLDARGTVVHVESGAMDSLLEIEQLVTTHLGVQL